MNRLIATIVLGALALTASAADDDKKTTKAAKTTKTTQAATKATTAPVAKPLVIPSDAKPNPDGTYSYTDKAGGKWIYSKTPFGISKIQDMTGSPVMPAAPAGQYMKAIDNGDTVKFERQSPFGTTKWEKKKSELTDEERLVLDRQATTKPAEKQP